MKKYIFFMLMCAQSSLLFTASYDPLTESEGEPTPLPAYMKFLTPPPAATTLPRYQSPPPAYTETDPLLMSQAEPTPLPESVRHLAAAAAASAQPPLKPDSKKKVTFAPESLEDKRKHLIHFVLYSKWHPELSLLTNPKKAKVFFNELKAKIEDPEVKSELEKITRKKYETLTTLTIGDIQRMFWDYLDTHSDPNYYSSLFIPENKDHPFEPTMDPYLLTNFQFYKALQSLCVLDLSKDRNKVYFDAAIDTLIQDIFRELHLTEIGITEEHINQLSSESLQDLLRIYCINEKILKKAHIKNIDEIIKRLASYKITNPVGFYLFNTFYEYYKDKITTELKNETAITDDELAALKTVSDLQNLLTIYLDLKAI